MTHNTYQKLKKEAEKITDQVFFTDYERLNDFYKSALIYNKRQNEALKEGFEDDIISIKHFFDAEKNELRQLAVRASKNYSRMQWFKLELCNALCLTLQETKKHI